MKISVIMSTYNSVQWLEKVLWGFSIQTTTDFEIIIADDGSKAETKEKIEALRKLITVPIIHVWHEDNGFQKSKILNMAIIAATGDYLIFTDGDCIPRKDFVATHLKYSQKGYFLSGGYFKLPMTISESITKEDIFNQQCFDVNWLKNNDLKSSFKTIKFKVSGFLASFLNFITPTKSSWNGHNASGWKADLVAVNGFNQEMQYGGQDRELGERLFNNGVKSKQIRYSAICVHLDHKRGYVNQETWKKNKEIRETTKNEKTVWTNYGIEKIK